jgi:A/G-specific adenine glycosylase
METDRDQTFSTRLIAWHQQHGRHDLPWQQYQDPYRVWLSEIMLQQTQVATVIPYYRRFLERFPTLPDLAAASVGDVMGLWSGLGYYARARNLHRCARVVMELHGGRFPQDPETIADLPGIGRSTANAIAVFCFGAQRPILDGNVKRVLCRTFGVAGFPGASTVERKLWKLAETLLPRSDHATYIQAQMDLGATVCSRTRPACLSSKSQCPVADICVAHINDRVAKLPEARPPRNLPQRESRVLLLRQEDRVLLERRPPSGIWGGLLSLPELAADADPATYAAQVLGCDVAHFDALPALRHNFTHFRLTMLPLMGEATLISRTAESTGYSWLRREDLDAAALPTPVRKILQGIFSR